MQMDFGRKALDARKGEELLRQLGAALDRYENLIESLWQCARRSRADG